MKVIETERLLLRRLSVDDAEFVLELLNEPTFIENAGDKGARTTEDASRYILQGPVANYEKFGFGLYLVELKESGACIGICGLVKRDSLENADLGFAFLERFRSKGYAYESAFAVMNYARNIFGLKRIMAVTAPDNESSIRILEKIGFKFKKMVELPEYGTDKLFVCDS